MNEERSLIEGRKYILVTMIPGVQRYPREHCMTYLGKNDFGQLSFSARPVAGTQEIDPRHILDAKHAPDDTKHYVNRRAPTK